MKIKEKIFETFYFITCIITIIVLPIVSIYYTMNHVYTTKAIVIATDNYEVYIETEDGNVWCFEDNRYNTNDALTVYFDDNCTEEITDDKIISTEIRLK